MKCEDCLFWEQKGRHHKARNKGFCRSHSPKVFVIGDLENFDVDTIWPETFHEEWCGEFVQGNK